MQFLTLDERSVESLLALAGGPVAGQTFTGTNGPDQLFGTAGDDVFRPLFGGDLVRGGPGTDRLELPSTLAQTNIFVTTPTELAFNGNVGTRSFAYTVQAVESFVFSDGSTYSYAQIVALAGNPAPGPTSGADTLTGTNGRDVINSLGGHDVVRGAGGKDTLIGGAGNDSLYGDAGDDRLVGGRGNDVLRGGSGNDTLLGDRGQDRLTGDRGTDRMHGGVDTSRDIFIFKSVADSAPGARRDVIYDFVSGTDDIDLRAIDARQATGANEAFTFSNSTPRAYSVWTVTKGSDLLVRADVTGDRIADFEIRMSNITSLQAGDLLL